MGLDREMQPKKIPVSLIILLMGLVVCTIGIIWWVNTDIGEYLDLKNINISQDADGVDKLRIEVKAASFELSTGGDKIVIDAQNIADDEYEFVLSDGEYIIRPKHKSFQLIFDIIPFSDKLQPKFKITVPDKLYEKIEVDVGVGDAKFDGFSVEDIDIDVGVGKAEFTNIKTNGKINCDVGVGELTYSGTVLRGLYADVGVGSAKFYIDGYYNDYSIESDHGVGDIDINKGDTSNGGNSRIPVELDVGVGDIELSFK